MKITVLGATGQIGSRVVSILSAAGHQVISASRADGVDVLTGVGLEEAFAGAEVVVDVTNSPSFEDEPVMEFFTAESANVVAAATSAGVRHVVALSIVGADGMPESGYMRAKVVQENTIIASGLPYTIVRATQFHEFAESIVGSLLVDGVARVPDARIQPIAAAEVADEVANAAQGSPVNGIVDLGGPEKLSFAQLANTLSTANKQQITVVVDSAAQYFGTLVVQDALVTGAGAMIGDLTFRDWLAAR